MINNHCNSRVTVPLEAMELLEVVATVLLVVVVTVPQVEAMDNQVDTEPHPGDSLEDSGVATLE